MVNFYYLHLNFPHIQPTSSSPSFIPYFPLIIKKVYQFFSAFSSLFYFFHKFLFFGTSFAFYIGIKKIKNNITKNAPTQQTGRIMCAARKVK